MIDSLILVRHAKAEVRSTDLDDHDRPLTSPGIRSARAALPRALGLIENPKDYRIWSSPATRAWQTAEIIAGTLGIRKIEQDPTLYSSEVAALKQKLNGEEGNLILVGHNPFLEELAEGLDPCHLHLGKAAVVCYAFPDSSWESAELAWFVQGPDASRWETIVEMEASLQEAARQVSAATWAFFDDPKDSDKLLELRESLKRCMALVSFVQPYLKKRKGRFLQETLSALYRDTSDLRLLDRPSQTSAQWSGIGLMTPDAQRMYDRLRIMEAERSRIVSKLQAPSRQRALHEASRQLRAPAWKALVEAEGIERSEVRHRFKKMRHKLQEEREAFEALPEGERSDETARKLEKREAKLDFIAESYRTLLQ